MNDKTPKSMWGPWSTDLRDPAERMAQLRSLRTLVHVLVGMRTRDYSDSVKHLEHALRVCESAVRIYGVDVFLDSGPLADARALFDALPSGRARDVIATFAVLHEPLTLSKEE